MLIRWVSLWSLLLSAAFALEIHDVSQDWRAAVIEKELAPFKEKGLTRDAIENYVGNSKFTTVFRYKIEKGQLTASQCYQFLDEEQLTKREIELIKLVIRVRGDYVIQIINRLLAVKQLPDMTFLVDLFDYPTRKDNSGIPIFTFSKLKHQKYDILMPDFEMLTYGQGLCEQVLTASAKQSWHSKWPVAFWRGTTTGTLTGCECTLSNWSIPNWKDFPRAQLVLKGKEHWELINARFTRYFQEAECNHDILVTLGKPATYVSIPDHLQFKYLVDIDGNASTYLRYFWILLSNSMPLKVTSDFTQWYYDGLTPYVHYLPVAPDVSDIVDKIYWAMTNDDEAHAIAMQSQQFAKQYLLEDSVYSYFYHLLLAYSELFENEPFKK